MKIKIKILNPEKFEEQGGWLKNNGYLSIKTSETKLIFNCWIFSEKDYIELKEIIEDKAKALLNLNHNESIIRIICKNMIFNDVRFELVIL